MTEYVTKEQVIDWFRPYGHMDESIPYETMVSDLRGMPAADVAPVRHGRWNRPYISWFLPIKIKNPHFFCTNCAYPVKQRGVTKYCHNCGAEMDGGADNG